MSGFIPVNLPAIQAKEAMDYAKARFAQQVDSKIRFNEAVETEGINPIAYANRLNRFVTINERRRVLEMKQDGSKILEVSEKTEEDLAQEFQNRNPELPMARLLRLRRAIVEGATSEEILDAVITEFSDPTLADEALEYLDRSTTGALREQIRGARALLQLNRKREIVAGRNVTEAARDFHEKGLGNNPTELRNLYRDITGTIRDHNAMFKDLSEKYTFDSLKLAVEFLLQSLGFDLKSKGPSIAQAELLLLMTEVRNLQSILWVYLFFKGRFRLIRQLFRKYGLSFPKKLHFESLAKEFMKLADERYPTMIKVLRHLEEMEMNDEAKIIILSQYRDAIRELSVRVYKSPKHQQDLLVLILETMDTLEEKREEDFE